MPYNINTIKDLENLPVGIALIGATERDGGAGKKWPCDQWRVTIGQGKAQFTTDYYTGVGHRKHPKDAPPKPKSYLSGGRESLAQEAWGQIYLRAVTPKIAAVLQSLVLDATADDMSFADWCVEYGCSEDSIKSLNTYTACCKIAKDLRQVFSRAEIDKIRELLQDY